MFIPYPINRLILAEYFLYIGTDIEKAVARFTVTFLDAEATRIGLHIRAV